MGEKALDVQVGGSHYKNMAIQPVEFAHANKLPFIEGSIIKYVCRHARKNGRKDLEKARHFIDLLIELEYPETRPEEPDIDLRTRQRIEACRAALAGDPHVRSGN